MNLNFKTLLVMSACLSSPVVTASEAGWYVEPILGLSNLSDTSGNAINIAGISGPAEISIDSGLVAGLGIGYQYSPKVSVELAWEYRSNDSQVALAGEQRFDEGNYASNTFFLNGQYTFGESQTWRPYIGAGLAWVQEIDIDLESSTSELSFSADGDTGFQVFAGLELPLNERLSLSGELRYLSISTLDLAAEPESIGSLTGLEYDPVTLQLGLKYRF